MLDRQMPPWRHIKPCCIICGNSEHKVFLPLSSNIFSKVMS
uniref:Uncharacterized protein n=1 Tax=Rhizophora mucronata TaxID=61149 RepID=A0A2P2NH49_RHIMU